MHYLDNAATTRVSDAAADAADRVLRQHFANPSSLYRIGALAEDVIETAREDVADSLGAKPSEIVFTGSGTEGDNMAIFGACHARRAWADHIVVTGYEHPAVQNAVSALEKDGWRVSVIAPDETGHVDGAAIAAAVTAKTALAAFMHVNNEVGTVLDVARIAAAVKQKNSRTAVHVDGVQAWGKVPLKLAGTAIDTYAVSGHKIHAPKGVGALYIRSGFHMDKFLCGGAQENGRRPGTQNTAFIAAMAAAIREMQADRTRAARVDKLATMLREELKTLDFVTLNSPEDAACGLVNFSVADIKSETMLHFLESKEICVSSGSACSKGEASHTLTAMGLAKSRIDTAIRVSFSGENTEEDAAALIAALKEGRATLARIRRR